MKSLSLESIGTICIIRLDNGVPNAISPQMVRELSAVLTGLKKDCRGAVLAGNAKFFSMGFDLPALIALDRNGMSEFFFAFHQTVCDLYTLPCPTIAVMNGHAVAGGCILALACDFRYSGHDDLKLGLNEVKLGVPVPYITDCILRQIAGDRSATRMMFEGGFITASEASTMGLMDKLLTRETSESEAVKYLEGLAAFPESAMVAVKANRTMEIKNSFEMYAEEKNREFLDCWFSEPVRELLKAASKKF